MKLFKRFLAVLSSAIGLLVASMSISSTANAALIACGGIQIEDTATCVISGSIVPCQQVLTMALRA
jgi:hypothetical protein